MASIQSAITDLQNTTAYNKAQQEKVYSSKVSSGDFLYLLTQQLQYQDPMNPMDNSEMLAQEAQFSTLEQMEALTSSFSSFSNIYQANALMGQTVEVSTEGGSEKGTVDYIDFSDSKGASVSIKGKLYPLSSVSKVYPKDTSEADKQTAEDRNFIANCLYTMGGYVANISNKVTSYIDNLASSEAVEKAVNTITE